MIKRPKVFRMSRLEIVKISTASLIQRKKGAFTRTDLADAFYVDHVQVSKFINEHCKKGLFKRSGTIELDGKIYHTFKTTRKWKLMEFMLSKSEEFTGRCYSEGCEEIVLPWLFRGRSICEKHLLTVGCRWCKHVKGECNSGSKGNGESKCLNVKDVVRN